MITKNRNGKLPMSIVLTAPNPLDPTTPVGVRLSVSGWGRGSKWVTYKVPGWEQIAPDGDEFVIGSSPDKTAHVCRMGVCCESYHK